MRVVIVENVRGAWEAHESGSYGADAYYGKTEADALRSFAYMLDDGAGEPSERHAVSRRPTSEGGPRHEEEYWLRQKLDAAITHLRDIEDYFIVHSGSDMFEGSYAEARASRARFIYEQITADFFEGKRRVPTLRERVEASEKLAEAAQGLARARRRKAAAKAALRAYREEQGSCDGGNDPCYSTELAFEDWCEVCQGSQPFYEEWKAAYMAASVAMRRLMRLTEGRPQ